MERIEGISRRSASSSVPDDSCLSVGEPTQYLVSKDKIQECNVLKKKYSSWFVDNSVISDGSLYIWSPIDPLFLLLPALERAQLQGSFCSVEHIVEGMDCGEDGYRLHQLIEKKSNQLKVVCDWKENSGETYFKLNNEKVLAWLGRKVEVLEKELQRSDPAFEPLTKEAVLQYAVGMVGEYISETWRMRLVNTLGIPATHEPSQEELGGDVQEMQQKKKPKLDKKQLLKAKQQEARQEAKAKQLAKETAGMKKLNSFFTKKPKSNGA